MEKEMYALSEVGRRETNENLCVLRVFGDMLLLCSDGLYVTMSGEDIKASLTEGRDVRENCEKLVAGAYSGDSRDNVSAIIIRLR